MKKLWLMWKMRHHPMWEFYSDYETLIKLARRCAYDLAHVVNELPKDSFFVTELGMRERSNWWIRVFAKGNPGKDYRHDMQRQIDDLERELEELRQFCDQNKLKVPAVSGVSF